MEKLQAVINNKFIDNGQWLDIIDPTSLQVAGSVTALQQKEIDEAFKAARTSQVAWEDTPLLKRIEILNVWKELIIKHREELANYMVAEIAKAKKDSLSEVDRTIEYIDFTFEEVKRLYPWSSTGEEMGAKNKIGVFTRVAKGVVLAISPFNYPINLSMAKIMPALVAGNTVVFKPATQGSMLGAYLGKLAVEAGLPAGIFNVVTGRGRDIGDLITFHKEIDMISFTGSVSIGNRIREKGSTTDLVLELGGKDPALVLDDIKLEKTADQIIAGAYGYSGQRCTAIKRVLVPNKIADKLVPMLLDRVNKLKVGDPRDNADIVPVIDEKTADYVQSLIDEAVDKGAKVITGATRDKNLMQPTLLDNVTVDMKVAWEEPFGPVLPIIRIDDVEEMIKITNESEFGLQASIFTQDISLAIKTAKKINVGSVNINSKSQRGPDSFPFLGVKNSGEGVQGIRESLLSMTRYKGIVLNY